jgi:hypothetical protein
MLFFHIVISKNVEQTSTYTICHSEPGSSSKIFVPIHNHVAIEASSYKDGFALIHTLRETTDYARTQWLDMQ